MCISILVCNTYITRTKTVIHFVHSGAQTTRARFVGVRGIIMKLVLSVLACLLAWDGIRYLNLYIENKEIKDLFHVFYAIFFIIYFVTIVFEKKTDTEDRAKTISTVKAISLVCGVLCLGTYHALSL